MKLDPHRWDPDRRSVCNSTDNPLRPALRRLGERLCKRGIPPACLSMEWRWHRCPVDPHKDYSLHLCTPSMSLETVQLKGPYPLAEVWDDGCINTPSIHTRAVCTVNEHYQIVLHQTTYVLLKGLSWSFGSRTWTFPTIKQLKQLLATFLPTFVHFRLLNVSQKV